MNNPTAQHDGSSSHSLENEFSIAKLAELMNKIAMARGNGASVTRILEEFDRHKLTDISKISGRLLKKSWQKLFPKSSFTTKALDQLAEKDYPCLIHDTSNNRFWICKGLSAEGLLVEDVNGKPHTLQKEDIDGFAYLFGNIITRKSSKPLTAGDLFKLAMKSHKRVMREALLSSFVAAILGVGAALYTMQVYDRVVPTSAYSTLVVLSAGVVIALLLEFAAKQIKSGFVDKAGESIDLSLSQLFFERGIDLRLETRPKTVGTLAAQIKNFEMVRHFMVTSLFFIWADLPFALFFLGVIWLIGGPIVLVPIILLPIGILFGLIMRSPIEKYTKLNMTESNKKSGLLIEALDGIETVKSSGGRGYFTDQWHSLSEKVAVGEYKVKRLSALASNVSQTLQQISYIGMVTFGAVLVTQGEITMGALIACTILSGRALGPLAQFPNMISQAKKSKIALEALDGLMSLPVDRDINSKKVAPDACRGELTTESLSFAYDQNPVASFPALHFPRGQHSAILGAVGSGKSTLLRMLAGLYKPNSGTVRLDDYDLQILSEDYIREQIFFLPQDVRLFSGTLRDNLTLGLPMLTETQISEACRLTGLNRVIANHPLGLDLLISEGGQGLSTGQRQLVGITRLMLSKPKIILLDEPTSALDRHLEQHLLSLIFNRHKQSTVIMVTHKINQLDFVDRVAVVDNGKMVMDGPRKDVLERLTTQPTEKAAS
jgi:ATP-binding cassette subfamily C protein LapB